MKTLLTILTLTVTTFTTDAHVFDNSPEIVGLVIEVHSTDPVDNTLSTEIVSLEKVPLVKVALNGQVAYFVLDSGSDVSLLHVTEADSYRFSYRTRASKSIIGASGGKQPLYEAAGVQLVIDQQLLQTQFYTTDLDAVVTSLSISTGFTISGIIGMDLMRRYGFEIDYLNQRLVLHSSV